MYNIVLVYSFTQTDKKNLSIMKPFLITVVAVVVGVVLAGYVKSALKIA